MKTTTKLSYLDNLMDKVMALGLILIVLGVLNALAILFSNDIAGLIKNIL